MYKRSRLTDENTWKIKTGQTTTANEKYKQELRGPADGKLWRVCAEGSWHQTTSSRDSQNHCTKIKMKQIC